MDEDDYRDDGYEWSEAKSADRMARSGFDFHAARRVLESDRYVERWDERHSGLDEERVVATGMLGPAYISVVYTPRGSRKRIISAFEADDDDIADFMVTYALE
ncbi:MAG: BrnT family toxin [Candidatus Eremiobacteraeota bacterium]|nr:BrnT family toxin [Candidatus Eremiobacteraeota bacterium]